MKKAPYYRASGCRDGPQKLNRFAASCLLYICMRSRFFARERSPLCSRAKWVRKPSGSIRPHQMILELRNLPALNDFPLALSVRSRAQVRKCVLYGEVGAHHDRPITSAPLRGLLVTRQGQ
jgi:hypothetical protein